MSSESQRCSDDMLTSHRSYVNSVYGTKYQQCPSSENIRKGDKKRLIIASLICLLFMLTEMIGGILSNSLALMTDAAHLLTDFGAFLVSLTSLIIAGKKRTRTMTFGYHRAEVIGALISILSIWLLTGILFYAAIQRFVNPDYEIDATIMLIVATIGLLANIVLGLILLFPNKSSNHNGEKSNRNRQGMALRSAFIHVLGDSVHTAGVLVASLVIHFSPELKIADPICTVIFSFIILVTTLTILKDIVLVLMEGVPKHISFSEIRNVLFSLPDVSQVHDLRMWSLTLERVAMSAHIVIKKDRNSSEVLKKATALIYENISDVYEVTLQVEEEPEEESQ